VIAGSRLVPVFGQLTCVGQKLPSWKGHVLSYKEFQHVQKRPCLCR